MDSSDLPLLARKAVSAVPARAAKVASVASTAPTAATAATAATAPRLFGRFQLQKLLGKSTASMAWLAFDPRSEQEVMLTVPRTQPRDAAAGQAWLVEARLAARLRHPCLAASLELGIEAQWPYVAVDRALGVTLGEKLATLSAAVALPEESVRWMCQVLEGLAYAHEAGHAHRDLQLHSILVSDQGQVRVVGLGVAQNAPLPAEFGGSAFAAFAGPAQSSPTPTASTSLGQELKTQREAAVRDVLSVGVVLQRLLSGQAVLDEPDTLKVMARVAPEGREIVRLPWATPHLVSEGLRAIANRCLAHQPRQRYLSARTLLQALSGWLTAQSQDAGGPLALLLDRLHTVGHLPAKPGVSERVTQLSRREGQHAYEIAEEILQDMALSFELLRLVNSAQVQGTQVPGNGPVLTIRRCIALMGLDGVRHAATALRAWPGPLSETGALALKRCMDQARWAGHVAQALRPAGYDAEVVYLVAVLQNLGRLLVQYHFGDEAEQIRQLTLSVRAPNAATSEPELRGLSEDVAAMSVLGVTIEEMGAAVARHWGMGDEVLHMIRPLSKVAPVRGPDNDNDLLRATASAANEAVDAAQTLKPPQLTHALSAIAQRYAKVLHANLSVFQEALESGKQVLLRGGRVVDVKDRDAISDQSEDGNASTSNGALEAH
jgi:eukaryotic-like serine/threonine-protein kinase